MLKKIYIIVYAITFGQISASLEPRGRSPEEQRRVKETFPIEQQLNVDLAGHNVQAFADNAYTNPRFRPEQFINWLKTSNRVKVYVLERSKDIFNKKVDPVLIAALQMLDKANTSLIASIADTYLHKRISTPTLALAAQQFQKIAGDVAYIIGYLEKTTFYLTNKKNAKNILLLWARYIEGNATKQIKDLRNPYVLLAAQQSQTTQQPQQLTQEFEEELPEAPTYTPSTSAELPEETPA